MLAPRGGGWLVQCRGGVCRRAERRVAAGGGRVAWGGVGVGGWSGALPSVG